MYLQPVGFKEALIRRKNKDWAVTDQLYTYLIQILSILKILTARE